MNQMICWITVKEEHACKIITTVSKYCLCQRVKKEIFAEPKDYTDALLAHHAVMQCAMKYKQNVTTDCIDASEHAVLEICPRCIYQNKKGVRFRHDGLALENYRITMYSKFISYYGFLTM
jgi:Nickel-containing superoxide dismutase